MPLRRWTVIEVYVCTQDEGGGDCNPPGYIAGIIAQVQAACGPNQGGWMDNADPNSWNIGLDPVGQSECVG
jgi:hypothetical protein